MGITYKVTENMSQGPNSQSAHHKNTVLAATNTAKRFPFNDI
jgi:hypothetical protein